ncbi:SDR family NAD(P)-dependent oxidoreductase [uncultured Friedmanniella sp.]|uniref:SDR family NAD(P)-dependent oxidoreductase n=1 Tax=uncultured Friedmanniella sp. TaxID=335381 RepID=UPI0035CB3996
MAGSGTSGAFGARSTALEVVDGIDLTGKTAVVTGGASGIGVETARALAQAGAAVTLAVRNLAVGTGVAEQISADTQNPAVQARPLDLADLVSVAAFVAGWEGPLHILVNNAGVMDLPEQRTAAGWEMQFATNHLGHLALALGLHPALAAAGESRIVSLSSSGHHRSPVVFDDLFFDRRPYDPKLAYGQSKTANVLFAVEASRRWAEDGITSNAVMPGGIWTGLQKHWDGSTLADLQASVGPVDAQGQGVKSPEQGAATSVLVATSSALAGIGGRYFEDCHEAAVVEEITDGIHGVRAYALDPDAARRLWDISVGLLSAALPD